MNFEKNQKVIAEITDMGNDGEGIAKVDGYTLFIKDAVIGDRVEAVIMKAKKNFAYARLLTVLTPSKDRVEPRCPIARPCGGCQLQALSYEAQLRYKENKVKNHLERIGGLQNIPMEPIIAMDEPFHYRNKAQFPVGYDKEGRLITGFYASRTHSIIDSRTCELGIPQNQPILEIVLAFMEEYHVTAYRAPAPQEPQEARRGKRFRTPRHAEAAQRKSTAAATIANAGLVRHILIRAGFKTGELMVCLVINGRTLPHHEVLAERLRVIEGMTSIMLNHNMENTNVILGHEVTLLWGTPYIKDQIRDVTYQISPLSFYQVNPVQTEKLYQKVADLAALSGTETVWDLYCGIGTISLFLAKDAGEVYGVEIISQAIDDAKENARINHIENAHFFVGKAEEVLPQKYAEEGVKADVIVVDPPRKGCDEVLLDTIVKMRPKKVVYVSCDSATLARDLKYLTGQGYEVEMVCPVDVFGETVHVETVVLLSLNNR
ncbi:MAG: 23S rRNA (uracil(1939)-C(5))-methyltransferase RlmD [Lachnospiraceae bacterium]